MSIQPSYEQELLLQFTQGNEKAFQSIFDTFWKDLYLYAFNVLKNKQAAEDVVQDIFSQLWQSRSTTNITSSLKGYLFSAVHYRILREIRTNKTIILDLSTLEERLMQESSDAILTVKDLQQHINRVVDHLPPKCREIYLLSRTHHYSHKEIAARLGISTKTVEAQLTIALNRIRQQLGNHSTLKIFFPFF